MLWKVSNEFHTEMGKNVNFKCRFNFLVDIYYKYCNTMGINWYIGNNYIKENVLIDDGVPKGGEGKFQITYISDVISFD